MRGYLAQRAELAEERAALVALEERRDNLRSRLQAVGRPEVLEARARELGLARPGERVYVVHGLPEPAAAPSAGEPDDDGGLFGWLPLPF